MAREKTTPRKKGKGGSGSNNQIGPSRIISGK